MSQWKGSFKSINYDLIVFNPVYGLIEADQIELGTPFTSSCTMTYQGAYRSGQTVNGILRSDGNNITANVGGIEVSFTIMKRDDKKISGIYTIISPKDYGTFELNRVI